MFIFFYPMNLKIRSKLLFKVMDLPSYITKQGSPVSE
jgi:hypothetical protein